MKEEIKYKSYSIRLVTLIGIALVILGLVSGGFITYTKLAKKDDVIEIATEGENATEEAVQSFSRVASVSSRGGEERANVEIENIGEIIEEEKIEEDPIIEVVPETNYISIDEVTIDRDMDLTETTGLSKEDFVELISEVKQDTSGFFEENAETIYDLCQEYELNEIFFCGLISAESGWTIAQNHRNTYNYISLMSGGKLIQYSSVEEGLQVAAQKLHDNYLTLGGKFYYGNTLSAVKTKFCPASSTWVDLVYGRMSQIVA